MRNITISFVSVLLLFICSESALACWCRGIDPEERIKTAVAKELRRSVIVFSGEAVERNASGLKFRVDKIWKGKANAETSLPQDAAVEEHVVDSSGRERERFIDSCARSFEVGQRYLVYADRGGSGELFVSKCSRTQLMESALRDLRELNRLRPKPRVTLSHADAKNRFSSTAKSN